jgi:hypothetical protein
MDPFNALSTTAAARKIPPLREAPPTKVMSCALVTSTDLKRAFDAVKKVIRGAGTPSVKMADRPWFVAIRPPPSRDEDRSPLARQVSPYARGHGTHPVRALSPRPTIRKEHRSVTPTCPTTEVLTPRKMTIWHQLVVPSSSSNDDLPLVKLDAWVDLNPSGARIHYT